MVHKPELHQWVSVRFRQLHRPNQHLSSIPAWKEECGVWVMFPTSPGRDFTSGPLIWILIWCQLGSRTGRIWLCLCSLALLLKYLDPSVLAGSLEKLSVCELKHRGDVSSALSDDSLRLALCLVSAVFPSFRPRIEASDELRRRSIPHRSATVLILCIFYINSPSSGWITLLWFWRYLSSMAFVFIYL